MTGETSSIITSRHAKVGKEKCVRTAWPRFEERRVERGIGFLGRGQQAPARRSGGAL